MARMAPRARPTDWLLPPLLQLWRVLPLPGWLRAAILWRSNTHYLVAVAALIWDDEGRLLLGRHTYLPPPGWSLLGGCLHGVESPAAGLARELAEELGAGRLDHAGGAAPGGGRLHLLLAERRLPAERGDRGGRLLPRGGRAAAGAARRARADPHRRPPACRVARVVAGRAAVRRWHSACREAITGPRAGSKDGAGK